MAKLLDTGEDKIQKICKILKDETIDPARREAEGIINDAHARAKEVIDRAEAEAKTLVEEAHQLNERERRVFQTSLEQAGAQAVETLKQSIEKELFNPQVVELITRSAANKDVLKRLIDAIVDSIKKEGASADFSVLIPQTVSVDEVNHLIGENILNQLKEKSVVLGDFSAGIQVKLHDKHLTLDISDRSLVELLSQFLREDFRDKLFKS